jgi:hypothetical protein
MNSTGSNIMDVTQVAQIPRRTLSLTAKLAVCKEASVLVSSSVNGIRSTARRYDVHSSQIRRWMKSSAAVDDTIHDSDNDQTIQKHKSSQGTQLIDPGRKCCVPEATLASTL